MMGSGRMGRRHAVCSSGGMLCALVEACPAVCSSGLCALVPRSVHSCSYSAALCHGCCPRCGATPRGLWSLWPPQPGGAWPRPCRVQQGWYRSCMSPLCSACLMCAPGVPSHDLTYTHMPHATCPKCHTSPHMSHMPPHMPQMCPRMPHMPHMAHSAGIMVHGALLLRVHCYMCIYLYYVSMYQRIIYP